jgi:tryptophan-rich sensory protein
LKYLALVIAIICFVIAICYALGVISWFADPTHKHHISHFVLFVVLGILALVWMRFAGERAPH